MSDAGYVRKQARRYHDGRWIELEPEVAQEYALTVMLDGKEFATIVCSPVDLEELVYGFLASEGVIRSIADIRSLSFDEERGFAYVELVNPAAAPSPDMLSKRFIGSCCGKGRQFYFLHDLKTARTSLTGIRLGAMQCIAAMEVLQQSSEGFRRTGGLHNAALFDQEGRLLAARSDIGRHNALDKLFGYTIRHRLKTTDKLIAFSGRLSSEVLLKSAKIGVGIILSKSAPTTLAIELAEDLCITMVGFIREGSLTVYSHPERII